MQLNKTLNVLMNHRWKSLLDLLDFQDAGTKLSGNWWKTEKLFFNRNFLHVVNASDWDFDEGIKLVVVRKEGFEIWGE